MANIFLQGMFATRLTFRPLRGSYWPPSSAIREGSSVHVTTETKSSQPISARGIQKRHSILLVLAAPTQEMVQRVYCYGKQFNMQARTGGYLISPAWARAGASCTTRVSVRLSARALSRYAPLALVNSPRGREF